MIVFRYVLKNRIFPHSPVYFWAKNLSCGRYTGFRIPVRSRFLDCNYLPTLAFHQRFISTNTKSDSKALTSTEKLRIAIKDYGSTVIVFHVAISLISLGGFYLAVSSGLDMIGMVQKLGLNVGERMSSVVEGAGTFAIAYAVHKVFAPVRISITLGTTPFVVRYLRKIGMLKPPKK